MTQNEQKQRIWEFTPIEASNDAWTDSEYVGVVIVKAPSEG
jgi:hypothetical protein